MKSAEKNNIKNTNVVSGERNCKGNLFYIVLYLDYVNDWDFGLGLLRPWDWGLGFDNFHCP